jgi:kynurenine formamidase
VRIVDLTHPFADGMPVFPGLPPPSFNVANVTELPPRAQLVVAPIELAAGNGGPARIFAMLRDGP